MPVTPQSSPPLVDAAAGTPSLRTLGTSATQAAAGNDARLPSSDQKAALAGSSGTPSASNKYVTDEDIRLSNSRAPSGDAGGDLGGTYPNPTIAKDGAAGTATMRTLGSGATQAAPGDHMHIPVRVPTDANTMAQWLLEDPVTNLTTQAQPTSLVAALGGQNLTVVGGILTRCGGGPFNAGGVRFTANNSAVYTADSVFEPANAITVQFWAYWFSAPVNQRLVCKNGSTGTNYGGYFYTIDFQIYNNNLGFELCNDNLSAWPNGLNSCGCSSLLLPIGQWVHIAGTWATGGPMKFYINGVLQAQSVNVNGTIAYRNRGGWWIGAPAAATLSPTNVAFNDLRIEQVERSAAYLLDLYQRGR